MSSTLRWAPVADIGRPLPYELKRVISRKLWDTDGSTGGGVVMVGPELLPYLEGLRDAGVDGAEELMTIIEEYVRVELWHEQ